MRHQYVVFFYFAFFAPKSDILTKTDLSQNVNLSPKSLLAHSISLKSTFLQIYLLTTA